jgi:hypothetical protein
MGHHVLETRLLLSMCTLSCLMQYVLLITRTLCHTYPHNRSWVRAIFRFLQKSSTSQRLETVTTTRSVQCLEYKKIQTAQTVSNSHPTLTIIYTILASTPVAILRRTFQKAKRRTFRMRRLQSRKWAIWEKCLHANLPINMVKNSKQNKKNQSKIYQMLRIRNKLNEYLIIKKISYQNIKK